MPLLLCIDSIGRLSRGRSSGFVHLHIIVNLCRRSCLVLRVHWCRRHRNAGRKQGSGHFPEVPAARAVVKRHREVGQASGIAGPDAVRLRGSAAPRGLDTSVRFREQVFSNLRVLEMEPEQALKIRAAALLLNVEMPRKGATWPLMMQVLS